MSDRRSERSGDTGASDYRVVTITHVDDDRVFVKRNTSRRTQPIAITTLLREYTYVPRKPNAG